MQGVQDVTERAGRLFIGRDPQKSKGVPELSLRDSRQRLWTLHRPGHMGKGSDTASARAWLRPPLIRPHVFLLPGPQQGRKFCTLRHFDLLRGRLSTYLQPQVSLRQVLPEVRMGITRIPGARQALRLQGKADQPKNGKRVHINQPDFIATIISGKIKRGQNLDELLRPEDFSEFRSAAGCIQWIAGQCRPDVSAWVSLASRGEETTYKELNMLYDTISHLQDTKDLGLIIPPVPIDSSTTVLAYSDASWANAMNQASQHGCIIGLAANTITEVKQLCAPVDWKSGRATRVCGSTLSAEAVAADSATDRVAFTSLSLAEFINGVPVH